MFLIFQRKELDLRIMLEKLSEYIPDGLDLL